MKRSPAKPAQDIILHVLVIAGLLPKDAPRAAGTIWEHVWTWCDPSVLTWMVQTGLLVEMESGEYRGWGYTSGSPRQRISEKGWKYLNAHRNRVRTICEVPEKLSNLRHDIDFWERFE